LKFKLEGRNVLLVSAIFSIEVSDFLTDENIYQLKILNVKKR